MTSTTIYPMETTLIDTPPATSAADKTKRTPCYCATTAIAATTSIVCPHPCAPSLGENGDAITAQANLRSIPESSHYRPSRPVRIPSPILDLDSNYIIGLRKEEREQTGANLSNLVLIGLLDHRTSRRQS